MGRLWRKLGCLAAESSAPVAKMRLHEGNILLYLRTDPQIVKIVTVSIFCDAITNLTDGHVSDDESHKYRWSKDINPKCTAPRQTEENANLYEHKRLTC